MRNPITSAFSSDGYTSIRQLAMKLLEVHPELFGSLDPQSRSLEVRLGKLDKGLNLDWWRVRLSAAECVSRELGIKLSALNLDRPSAQHLFSFPGFPDLPALDLSREDRYSIARPLLISSDEQTPPAWKNLEYWFFGEGTNPTPQQLDWLHIDDDTEFRLVTAHLHATSRHAVVSLERPALKQGDDAEALRHRSPLILSVDEMVGPTELQTLMERGQIAPLLVISPYALPEHRSGASTSFVAQGARGVNTWRWMLHPNWRDTLLEWVGQRLARQQVFSALDPIVLSEWLHRFDPDHRWFPSSSEVLQLCQIAHEEPPETFDEISSGSNVFALLARIFRQKETHLKLMREAVRLRWRDWRHSWDGALDRADWLMAGTTARDFDAMAQVGLIAHDGYSRYRFANPVLARLLLRESLGKQIRMRPPAEWSAACFDSDRRPLLDATLDTMSMPGLSAASARLIRISGADVLMGPAEALFVAIGKRIARGAVLQDAMHDLGQVVLSRLAPNPDSTIPWSRQVTTVEQKFEWFSSTWAWSLQIKAPRRTSPSWCVPGWSHDLPDELPQWLNPRANFSGEDRAFPRGAALVYFMRVAHLWSKQRKNPPSGHMPALLNPALLWRASNGAWPVNVTWWGGIISNEWAEQWLVEALSADAPGQRASAARRLWPSLVAWQHLSRKGSGVRFARGKDVDFPSCRPDARLYSPILAWVADQLDDGDVLGLLEKSDRRFVEDHPQWLLTTHKIVVLRALAARLPLPLQLFEPSNYFSPFVPDAVEGLTWFLSDQALGVEAASGVWNWAPGSANELLIHGGEADFMARRQLIMTCPTSHLKSAMTALRNTPELLPEERRLQWVQYHLPHAGESAVQLFEMIR